MKCLITNQGISAGDYWERLQEVIYNEVIYNEVIIILN